MTVRRLVLAKEILWGSETAADTEARAKEVAMIYLNRANDPAVGYNVLPRFRGQGQVQPLGGSQDRSASPPLTM